MFRIGFGLWCLMLLLTIFQIGGGNRSTWRKPLTCRKSLTNLYRAHLTCAGFHRYVANMYSHTFWFVLVWGRLPPSMSVIYEISLRWMIIFPCWNGYVWKFPNCFFAYSELMGQSHIMSLSKHIMSCHF
jgi:hypothetical protein